MNFRPAAALLLLSAIPAWVPAADPAPGQILEVDRRGGAAFKTLRDAAKAAQPGDTIHLAPGSGPYREELFIGRSGEPGKPITVDGAGETISALEPLTGFTRDGETWKCNLAPILDALPAVQGFRKEKGKWISDAPRREIAALPAVLTYRGERLLQDASTGQLTRYATLSSEADTLTLRPGTSAEGWEISRRVTALRVTNASHHVYRNLKMTGSLNDGVNGHGSGEDLLFENIECFHNLDEGFSIHDTIHAEIRGANFWGNDNGMANAPPSEVKATDVLIWGNLGWGLALHNGTAELKNITIWGNGVVQFALEAGAHMTIQNVRVYTPGWTEKPYLSYTESSRRSRTGVFESHPTAVLTGDVTVLDAEKPEDAATVKP